jgi:hypothetical protein
MKLDRDLIRKGDFVSLCTTRLERILHEFNGKEKEELEYYISQNNSQLMCIVVKSFSKKIDDKYHLYLSVGFRDTPIDIPANTCLWVCHCDWDKEGSPEDTRLFFCSLLCYKNFINHNWKKNKYEIIQWTHDSDAILTIKK